jgi:hypothetical protein
VTFFLTYCLLAFCYGHLSDRHGSLLSGLAKGWMDTVIPHEADWNFSYYYQYGSSLLAYLLVIWGLVYKIIAIVDR